MEMPNSLRILPIYGYKMAAEFTSADTVIQGGENEYWSWWWQNYSYWYWAQSVYGWQHSHGDYDNQYKQWLEYFNSANTQGGVQPVIQPVQRRRFRLIGYEVHLAHSLRRIIAELIDMFILSVILNILVPGFDCRIPEELVIDLDLEELTLSELLEVETALVSFMLSVLLLRCCHIIVECICTSIFRCTVGKWLMGLKTLNCNRLRFTRGGWRAPSALVEPGTTLPLWRSLIRSVCKAVVSLFCPLLVLLVFAKNGQTVYDRLTKSVVVHVSHLYRPVYSNELPNT